VLAIGQDPLVALNWASSTARSAAGYNFGYTLYYATNFIFTGLAVAVAAHAGLFNIGGNGQAYIAGLGVMPWRWLRSMPWWVTPLAILAAAAVGGFWAFIPGWLQAKRGSHVVITTIMFNFIAAAIMVYMVVNVVKGPANVMAPESRDDRARAPACRSSATFIPHLPNTPTSTFDVPPRRWCCLVAVWFLIWRTKLRLRHPRHGPESDRHQSMPAFPTRASS
jgi:ABC-type uncharacterized transport system permease subunit